MIPRCPAAGHSSRPVKAQLSFKRMSRGKWRRGNLQSCPLLILFPSRLMFFCRAALRETLPWAARATSLHQGASRRPCRCCICVLAEAGCFGESFRGRHLGFVWKEGCSSSSSNSSCSSNIYCTWALAFPFNISLSRLHHINFISFSRWDKTRRVGLTLIPSYLLVICCSPTPYCSGLQGTGPSVGPCVGLVVWFPLFPIRFRVGKRFRQDLKGLGGHEHR